MTTALAPQTVQRLVVTSFKRLTDIEIVPDAETPTVQITGRNAQGKSSVLDALETVFAGVDNRRTPKPIHEGDTTARIVAETQDLVITRTFRTTVKGTDSTLTVAARDGARYGSPQKMMDELFGLVAVDPWAFATMSAKEQKALLLSLVDLPFDLEALDAERTRVFSSRTDANRELRLAEARVQNAPVVPEDAEVLETSAGDLISRISEATEHARALADAQRRHSSLDERAEALRAELARVEAEAEVAAGEVAALEGQEVEDVEELSDKLRDLEDSNRQARDNARMIGERQEYVRAAEGIRSTVEALTERLQVIDAEKSAGLAAASFPVEGLGFTEDGITYQGQPFEQASTAERIRVSFAVATAKPGSMRVVLIRNGESLDRDNLALVGELAAEAGFQVWIERVSEVRELGVFQLEDGKLAE